MKLAQKITPVSGHPEILPSEMLTGLVHTALAYSSDIHSPLTAKPMTAAAAKSIGFSATMLMLPVREMAGSSRIAEPAISHRQHAGERYLRGGAENVPDGRAAALQWEGGIPGHP